MCIRDSVGTAKHNTLAHLDNNREYKAKPGQSGGVNGRTGARGEDCILEVPLGTRIINRENDEFIGEITEEGQKLVIAKGGKHGWGNIRYKSSVTRTPYKCTPGLPGEEIKIKLELNLLADIGLAGFPNAGKSSLLRQLSKAKPQVGDYPFTTINPQLGVIDERAMGGTSCVIADVPGLIEGASAGEGLGHKFLKHLRRTKCIAFIVDEYSQLIEHKAIKQVEILREELKRFSQDLHQKPFFIILNKIDLVEQDVADKLQKELQDQFGCVVLQSTIIDPKLIRKIQNECFRALNEIKQDYL